MGEIEKLKCFAGEVIACHTGTLDGCDIEALAIKYGLMKLVNVSDACSEECECAAIGNIPGVYE